MIFNRPDLTRAVFERIRAARPQTLLVVADGPRTARIGEEELCGTTRKIATAVDWPCRVLTNFSDVNMGCGERVSSGITWAFTLVDKAIILEDDCVPDPSFFKFCAELLVKYEDNSRVMSISGFCHHPMPDLRESYFFTPMPTCWGWATWRRAWEAYDYEMKDWETFRESKDWRFYGNTAPHLKQVFEMGWKNDIDTWDYQWAFTCLSRRGVCIMPKESMVSNTGFGSDATHTIKENQFTMISAGELSFPLSHPLDVEPNKRLSRILVRTQFEIPKFVTLKRMWEKIRRFSGHAGFPGLSRENAGRG